MTIVFFKWVLVPLLFVALAGAVFTKRTFHVEQIIPAAPEKVWAALMDTSSYPSWNPVFVAVEGNYELGGRVKNSVRFPDGSVVDMNAAVRVLEPNAELRQYGGVPGFLTFEHRWLLEPVEGGTKVTQHEIDRGIYLWFWNSDWIEPAYQSVLNALSERLDADN